MGIKNRNKKNKGRVAVAATPRSGSVMDKRPKFSLKHLAGDYCVSLCDRDDKAAVVDTLHKMSKLTWSDIYRSGRHKNGFEKIAPDSLSWLAESFTQKTIIAFRFNGMKPMLGFQDKEVFYILAIDRNYTAYKH